MPVMLRLESVSCWCRRRGVNFDDRNSANRGTTFNDVRLEVCIVVGYMMDDFFNRGMHGLTLGSVENAPIFCVDSIFNIIWRCENTVLVPDLKSVLATKQSPAHGGSEELGYWRCGVLEDSLQAGWGKETSREDEFKTIVV